MRKRVTVLTLVAAVGLTSVAVATGGPWSTFVNGNLVLDDFGNTLRVHATAVGSDVSGRIVFHTGPQEIEIEVTCLQQLSSTVAIVGGTTVRAEGPPTIFPNYSFVLEDRGRLPAKWTAFSQFPLDPDNPCAEAFGPAVETSIRGHLDVRTR